MHFLNAHTHFHVDPDFEIFNAGTEPPPAGWYSAGIHPWDSTPTTVAAPLEKMLYEKQCVALGEAGLDKLRGPGIPVQEKVFRAQVALSEKHGLPLIIHCVKAWAELLAIYKELQPEQRWIYHGFNKAGILREVSGTGIMISLGSAVLKNGALQRAVRQIPDERLLVETDDSKIDIREIYACISDLKQISLPALQELVFRNFKQTFTRWTNG